MTTDVSAGGAFLNVAALPPVGAVIEVTLVPEDELAVKMTAMVQRVIEPTSRISVVPGVGVAWLQGRSASDSDETRRGGLRYALGLIFGRAPRVKEVAGRPIWHPTEKELPTAERQGLVRDDLATLRRASGARIVSSRRRSERRDSERFASSVDVTVFVNRRPIAGQARDVSVHGLWIDSADPPPSGEVATCRYPVPDPSGCVVWVRLVGVVVRSRDERMPGFGLELLNPSEHQQWATYAAHIEALESRRFSSASRPERAAPRPSNVVVLDRFRS